MNLLMIGAAAAAFLGPATEGPPSSAGGAGRVISGETTTDQNATGPLVESDVVLDDQVVGAPKHGTWGFDLDGRDMTVSPGDNFFRHANGAAVDGLRIPSDRVSYGAQDQLRELSEGRVRTIIHGLASRTDLTPGSDEQKIADAYRAIMDEARIEQLDADPLQPLLAAIRAAGTHRELAVHMGSLQGQLGVSLFATDIAVDEKAPDRYVVWTGQGGLGLPNRDYYLEPRWADKKALYRLNIEQMLTLAGWDAPSRSADTIVALEDRIAEAHWSLTESRDREAIYNDYTLTRLVSEAPGFAWRDYYGAVGVSDAPRLIVRQNTALPRLAAIFADTPVETLQAWQAFHTVDQAAPALSRRFADLQWAFRSRDLLGQPVQTARDKLALAFAEGVLGEAVGRRYVAEYFPAGSRDAIETIADNLTAALGHRIRTYDWMSDATKGAALEKLGKFGVKVGYPNRWRDYSGLEIRPDDLFGNGLRAGRFQWTQRLERLNGPVDRDEWNMPPQSVGAYYNATSNEIVVTAAMLQPPFFDPEADPAVNYGGIGAVIGHEIGHGFDDQGSRSDGDGVLRDWWTPADQAQFKALNARLGAQYDQFEPLPGFHVQGGLTMGENIGDAAGVAVGLEAYHLSLGGQPAPVIDGVTGDQRFFYGWAQVWRSSIREEALKQYIATNPHSPAEFRALGPLRNIDAWYEAFDVQPAARYYLAPEDRVRIW